MTIKTHTKPGQSKHKQNHDNQDAYKTRHKNRKKTHNTENKQF